MSMYNLMFGENAASDFLLALLDLTRADVGRFRDAYVTDDGKEIAVYTRNGGGNREHWGDEEAEPDCSCAGCIIEVRLPKHPLYLRDEDDDFDSTYATVFFRVPEAALPLVKDLAERRDPNVLWLSTLEELKQGKRPDVIEKLRPLMDSIAEKLRGQLPRGTEQPDAEGGL
jgi:hypothetical protein